MTGFQLGLKKGLSQAFNLPVLQTERKQWVDYLRGIAIVLIVYRHILIGIQRGQIEVPNWLVDANMVFYSFRMPLFFLLSGLFIGRTLQKHSLRKVGWIKFEHLLYPYLVWATIQVSLQIALSHVTNSERTFLDYTYILYQPRFLDQFWYLPALFNASTIYILLKKKVKLSTGWQLACGLCFYFVSPYLQSVSMLSDWMEFYFFFALGDALSTTFFKQKVQAFFRRPSSLLMIVPFFIAAQYYYLTYMAHPVILITYEHGSRFDYLKNFGDQVMFMIIALTGCTAMFSLAFLMERWRSLPFLRILGYHSLYIYVMHVIITAFIRLSLIVVFGITNPVVLLGTCMFFGLTIPVAVYNLLMKKDKWLWFLFTYKRAEKTATSLAPAAVVAAPELIKAVTTVAVPEPVRGGTVS